MRLHRLSRRSVSVGVGIVLLAGIGIGTTIASSGSSADTPGFTESRRQVPVIDGPNSDQHIMIDTDLFTPRSATARHPEPAIILSHGFGGSLDSERGDALAALKRGYVVLTYTARGFGKSTGQVGLDSPDYEVKDVHQLVDALGTDPVVLQDGTDDPRVGLAGGSYGGGISLLAAAYDHRVDAVAAAITWNDLAESLNPNGVFKQGWASLFFGLGTLGGATTAGPSPGTNPSRLLDPQPCPGFIPAACAAYAQTETDGIASPATVALLHRDSIASVVNQLRVPTLLMQGQHDTLFPLSQAQATTAALAANKVPHQEVWLSGGHDSGFGAETRRVQDLTGTWFDRWLGRRPKVKVGPIFSVARSGTTNLTSDSTTATGGTVSYPLGAAFGQGKVGSDAPAGQLHVVNPPGGQPAALSSLPGFGALTSIAGSIALDIPTQNTAFDGPTLQQPLEIVGAGQVMINIASTTGSAVLFVKLYDVDAEAKAVLPDGQLTPVRLTGLPTDGRGKRVTLPLPALSWRFATGHHLRLTMATTDQAYLGSRVGAAYTLDTTGASFSVPLSTDPATGGIAPLAIAGIALAVLIAIGALIALISTRRRRRDREVERATATSVAERADPLVISSLSKTYGDRLIVDGVTLTVKQGQVLGLLGPNGAGKTTTLRMVLGLIRPTGGEVMLFGTRVLPGSPALRRVGAFVEGPGFVPTLSGLDNLKLWWGADGDAWVDARADAALEVAGLGDAIHRKVKTYSQGMRQRLAIAQAMLGNPDLVVLDEPTNGLDPPQIVEMRRVITRMAERGATVLISSHLLSEVEQVCTHVAVMSQGRLVKTGTVAEVIGADSTVAVEFGGSHTEAMLTETARRVARIEGVESVSVDGAQLVVALDGIDRVGLLAALVGAGLPVSGIAPRKALETAFLELVS